MDLSPHRVLLADRVSGTAKAHGYGYMDLLSSIYDCVIDRRNGKAVQSSFFFNYLAVRSPQYSAADFKYMFNLYRRLAVRMCIDYDVMALSRKSHLKMIYLFRGPVYRVLATEFLLDAIKNPLESKKDKSRRIWETLDKWNSISKRVRTIEKYDAAFVDAYLRMLKAD